MKNWKLKTQLELGFGIVLCFACIVGATSFIALGKAVKESDIYRKINHIQMLFNHVLEQTDQFILNSHDNGRDDQAQAKKRAKEYIEICHHSITETAQSELLSPEISTIFSEFSKTLKDYEVAFSRFSEAEAAKIKLNSQIRNIFIGYDKLIQSGAIRVDEMLTIAKLVQAGLNTYMERPTDAYMMQNQERMKRFQIAIKKWYLFIEKSENLKGVHTKIKERFDRLTEVMQNYYAQISSQRDLQNKMKESSQNLKKISAKIGEKLSYRLERGERIAQWIIVCALLSVLLLGALFAWMITRTITKPILAVTAGLKDVAEGEGDLTKRLNIQSKNEVGELASWFNVFIDNMNRLITKIAQNTTQLDTASNHLFNISGNLSDAAVSMSSRFNLVACASEEMSSTMNSMASTSEQASNNLNAISAATEEMNATVNEIASNSVNAMDITEQATVRTKRTSERVNHLGKAANAISQITEVITEISEQTNLLALNATIEAARAGDAGKGFSVVANEIKELAGQTAEATRSIKAQIDDIQNATSQTITDIEDITKVISNVNETVAFITTAVKGQASATREISININQAAEGISDVNKNVCHSSNTSKSITDDIGKVNKDAEDMTNSSSEVKMNADKLSKLSAHLNTVVGRFKY